MSSEEKKQLTPAQLFFEKRPRLAGLLLLLISAGLSYWLIFLPINEAQNQATQITISLKGILISVSCFMLGMLYLILGERFASALRSSGESKTKVRIISVIFAIIGLAGFLFLKNYLGQKGYIFN